jgi:hypothetical protein
MGLTGGVSLVLTTAAVTFAQTTAPDYRTMIVQSYKQKAPATLGYNCVPKPDGTGGQCTDAEYPLKFTNTVTIRPNGEVTLLLRAQADYVRWRTARIDGTGEEVITAQGEARSVTKTRRRWRITLPKRISRTTDLMGFDVQSTKHYSSFEIGAKIGKTMPSKKK